jgi:hypothetical protein
LRANRRLCRLFTRALELVAAPAIEKRVFIVHGRQVMLEEDLADLYGVKTKHLIQQVKHNLRVLRSDRAIVVNIAIMRGRDTAARSGRHDQRLERK